MAHSTIVGGSTAKRVIRCPASVELVAKAPPRPPSKYAEEGSLLHEAISHALFDKDTNWREGLNGEQEDKINIAVHLFEQIDPTCLMQMSLEKHVEFGSVLPGAFGSCDLIGRLDDTVIILDWKFGDGVVVEAEENAQLMFYAAAAMRTPDCRWAFNGAKKIECIIIQPPYIRRWETTFDRIRLFERELIHAVKVSTQPDPPLRIGDHCKFCPAKPTCPAMTGAVDRAMQAKVNAVDTAELSKYLELADTLEDWISDVRAFALQMLESNATVPGYKLVAKRATRQWVDETAAKAALMANLPESEVMVTSLISPAQAEKKLKKLKLPLPDGQVVAVSSGNTLAREDDPRPPVLLIGQQLTAALSKIV